MQGTLAKLNTCRTPVLGGRKSQCDACGEVSEVYHSCGDRHCPQCSGRKRYDFAARAEQLLLESVPYYQVVFTLPSELSELALANRLEMADLLFRSAWKSLSKTVRVQQDYDPAAMMVLHTWNQRLEPHWHVHALIPGGGPSLSGDRWKTAAAPEGATNSDGFYLVDAISLREIFRARALAQLKRLRRRGKLKLGGKFAHLQDDAAWETFCDELSGRDWVSFIQPPPTASCSAEQVVRYLTRYLTGGPISDGRITAADAGEVTFLAREGVRTGGERRQVPVTLPTSEFIRRWCQHIQPEQLTKTRYFGGWSGTRQRKYVVRCEHLLKEAGAFPEEEPLSAATGNCFAREEASEDGPRCPHCEEPALRLLSETPKPSWSTILNHLDPRCPEWYAEQELAEFRRYLWEAHGVDYADWYLETQVESAMRTATPSPPIQLYFAGMCPARDFQIESF